MQVIALERRLTIIFAKNGYEFKISSKNLGRD